ncbi:MAG: HupE/UreJ family protein [Flavobacteriales bacterium]
MNFVLKGIAHITDLEGYDHMLFLWVMCLPFAIHQWKQPAILATASTVGHSISLALAVTDVVHISQSWIEFLIPTTIFMTAIANVLVVTGVLKPAIWTTYITALVFGCIHGAGFSTYLRMIMDDGSSLLTQLFQFNCGVELGQILILFIILILTSVAARVGIHRGLNMTGSALGGVLALWMMVERYPL